MLSNYFIGVGIVAIALLIRDYRESGYVDPIIWLLLVIVSLFWPLVLIIFFDDWYFKA